MLTVPNLEVEIQNFQNMLREWDAGPLYHTFALGHHKGFAFGFHKGGLVKSKLSNNHNRFLCHVTFHIYSKYNIGAIYASFDVFYLRVRAVLKWKTLLPLTNFPKTTLVICSV